MDKSQLIARIFSEVKDPVLREQLLRQVAKDKGDRRSSLVLGELEKLGIDPKAAKDLVGFHLKARVISGYLVGGLFFLGGGLIALLHLLDGSIAGAVFPGFFAAMGAYALASTRKLSRLKSH